MNNFKFNQNTLQGKIFLSIFTILTLAVLSLFVFDYFKAKSQAKDYLKTSNDTINKILTQNIRGYIYNQDIANIKLLIDAVDSKYIGNIYITSPDGQILYSKVKTKQKIYNLSFIQDNDFVNHSSFTLLDINLGHMIIEANIDAYNDEVFRNTTELFLRLFMIFGIGIIISWLISRQISEPIDAMILYLHHSKTNEPFSFEKQNIEEFNFLATKIEEQRNALIDLNLNLEEKIKYEVDKNSQIENKLFQSEKLASMGEMIGNIAHQWRQPLTVITTSATAIQLKKEYGILTDEYLDESCENINQNAQYLSKTIDDFKNFIKGDNAKTFFTLNENIDSFVILISSSLKANFINLVTDIDKNIIIYGYSNELIQCYMNIFNNSKDALNEVKHEKYFFITAKIENNMIKLSFRDNAGGIPIKILPKIFNPYFTTKHQTQGTGLGLSMTYNLITSGMNGEIEAKNIIFSHDNKDYNGAEFNITLPINKIDKNTKKENNDTE